MSAPETIEFSRPPDPEAATLGPAAAPLAPPSVPGYEVIRELGRGGMGVVYLARDLQLGRLVALKMVLAGGHASAGDLQRFRGEAAAVARLTHPNIVQVYEVGEAGGLPYFALEYCDGGSLHDRLDGTPWPPPAAAELIETLAGAVAAAHAAGVIHRDLKPANVLLQKKSEIRNPKSEQRPDADFGFRISDFELRISDFGLAKRLDSATGLTRTGAVLGTPSYMAPEQADGSRDVGPAADVYALGAILYELLTGRPPFKAATPLDTILQVLQDDPVPPTRLVARLPRDLGTVALKCLAKTPARRYGSAGELADDLRRWRAGEPIRARPVGAGERAWKWARRRPAAAALVAVSLVALAGLFGVGLWYNAKLQLAFGDVEAERVKVTELQGSLRAAIDRATAEGALARRNLYAAGISLAQNAFEDGNLVRARELLAELKPTAGQPDPLRGWEWHHLHRLCAQELRTLPKHDGNGWGVAFGPDGRHVASAAAKVDAQERLVRGEVLVRDADTGAVVFDAFTLNSGYFGVAYVPGGRFLAVAVTDEAVGHDKPRVGWVYLLDLRERRLARSLGGVPDGCYGVAVSPDGRSVAASGGDGTVRLWDLATGQERAVLRGHAQRPLAVAFSPDSTLLASGGEDRAVILWRVADGQVRHRLNAGGPYVMGLAFRGDGKLLAAAAAERGLRVWDVESGKVVADQPATDWITGVAFRADGGLIWAGGASVVLQHHTARPAGADADGERAARGGLTLDGAVDSVEGMALSPDGERAATVEADGTVRLWSTYPLQTAWTLRRGEDAQKRLAFSPDGRRVATAGTDAVVRVYDARTGAPLLALPGHGGVVHRLIYSPGGLLVSCGDDGAAYLWDDAGRRVGQIELPGQPIGDVAVSPDGHWLAAATGRRDDAGQPTGGEVQLFPLTGGVVPRPAHIRAHRDFVWGVAFRPDGRRLVTISRDGQVLVWDLDGLAAGQVLTEPLRTIAPPVTPHQARWSRDGRFLALASADDRRVVVVDADSGAVRQTLTGHSQQGVSSLAFSPDGRRLATAGKDETVRLWDWELGQELVRLKAEDPVFGRDHPALQLTGVWDVAFSPDGTVLGVAGEDGLKLWDTRPPDAAVIRERAAAAAVAERYRRTWLREDVLLAALWPSRDWLSPRWRAELRQALRLIDDPERLQQAAWGAVFPADGVADLYPLALRQARAARRMGAAASALAHGAALYRLGRYREALDALRDDLAADDSHNGSSPATLAFLAMTWYQLGCRDEAWAVLGRMQDRLAELPAIESVDDLKGPAEEAQRLLLEQGSKR